jgi:hypothetical protein
MSGFKQRESQDFAVPDTLRRTRANMPPLRASRPIAGFYLLRLPFGERVQYLTQLDLARFPLVSALEPRADRLGGSRVSLHWQDHVPLFALPRGLNRSSHGRFPPSRSEQQQRQADGAA